MSLQPIRFLALLLGSLTLSAEVVEIDPALPDYAPVPGVSGNLDSIGSDTLNNLMTLWAEAFKARYPSVNIQIEGKGSSTAPPALIEGTAQIGPMSREMKPTEEDQFDERFGYRPTAIPIAMDALAIYVHKDNPLEFLTLQQLDGIYSNTYKREGNPLRTWGDLGLEDEWRMRPIAAYGRYSASGTYGYFKEVALAGGDFRPTAMELLGSSSVVQGVATDIFGIGYSGIGYRTSGVKVLALGHTLETAFAPTYENCLSLDYPLARFLYVYVNKPPNRPLDPLTYEFIRFVLSRQGQEIVAKDGSYPLTAAQADQLLSRLR